MTQCAYLFLDEGGNFDFSPIGTRYFVMSSVAMRRPFPAHGPLDDLKHDCLEYGLDTEYFHCADDNTHVRRKVFELIAGHLGSLRIDSLIVEKAKTGPALRVDEAFYPKMLGYLLRYVVEREMVDGVEELIVITDTIPVQKKRKAIEKAIKTVLATMLPAGMRTASCITHRARTTACSWQTTATGQCSENGSGERRNFTNRSSRPCAANSTSSGRG